MGERKRQAKTESEETKERAEEETFAGTQKQQSLCAAILHSVEL
jgi:hypothetical protein